MMSRKFFTLGPPFFTVPFTQPISAIVTFWPTPSSLHCIKSFMVVPYVISPQENPLSTCFQVELQRGRHRAADSPLRPPVLHPARDLRPARGQEQSIRPHKGR